MHWSRLTPAFLIEETISSVLDIILGFYLIESVAGWFLMSYCGPRIHLDAAYVASQVQIAPAGAVCTDVARLTSLTDQFCDI